VIVDAHAHYVPPSIIEALTSRSGQFSSVKMMVDGEAVRFAFAQNEA